MKQLFIQCLKGLAYLHAKKILHRDIKPQNILVSESGVAKLCDFNTIKKMSNTFAKTEIGSPLYMAPETH